MLAFAVMSEFVKLRRTFLLHSIWVFPLCVVAICFPVVLTRTTLPPGFTAWGTWMTWVMTIWNSFFMIFYGALAGLLLFSLEHSGRAWKHVYSQPTSRVAWVSGKLVTLFGLITVAHLALFLFILIGMKSLGLSNAVYATRGIPLGSIGLIVAGSCACAMSAAFICAAVSMRTSNPALAIGLTILGICLGALIADTGFAAYYPWTMGNVWFKESYRTLTGTGASSFQIRAAFGPMSAFAYSGLAMILSCASEKKRDVT